MLSVTYFVNYLHSLHSETGRYAEETKAAFVTKSLICAKSFHTKSRHQFCWTHKIRQHLQKLSKWVGKICRRHKNSRKKTKISVRSYSKCWQVSSNFGVVPSPRNKFIRSKAKLTQRYTHWNEFLLVFQSDDVHTHELYTRRTHAPLHEQ